MYDLMFVVFISLITCPKTLQHISPNVERVFHGFVEIGFQDSYSVGSLSCHWNDKIVLLVGVVELVTLY